MTIKEILKGLEFRLNGLRKSYAMLEKELDMEFVLNDYDARIDELESIYHWIDSNKAPIGKIQVRD